MPEEKSPTEAVLETRKVINALASRIYDSQLKSGVFPSEKLSEDMIEDWSELFADLHSKVSDAYQSCKSDVFLGLENAAPNLLIEVAMSCMGLCMRLEQNVGKIMLDQTIAQAHEAVEIQKARLAQDVDILGAGVNDESDESVEGIDKTPHEEGQEIAQ